MRMASFLHSCATHLLPFAPVPRATSVFDTKPPEHSYKGQFDKRENAGARDQVLANASGPIRAVQGAVLDGFAQVPRLNARLTVQVRDGPGDLQDAVMRPRRKPEAGDGVFQQLFAFGRNDAVLSNHLRHHLRVCVSLLLAVEPLELSVARGDHALPYRSGILRRGGCPQFFVLHGGNFNVNINAIQQRSRDFRNVTLDHRWCAMAFTGGVAEVPARAGIHCRRQHEPRGKRHGYGGTRNGHSAVLKRLPHDLQNVSLKLWQFVQEQHAIVPQRDFARPRNRAATDQPCIANRMVRRTERARADQPPAVLQCPRNTVNARRFNGLLELHRGHEDRKSTRMNSSHRTLSYAAFCMKQKKKTSGVESLKKTKKQKKTKIK